VTATGRGQETQEERIEGQSAKQNEKATIPEEIAAWGRPSPQRHAEYDGIQKLEKAKQAGRKVTGITEKTPARSTYMDGAPAGGGVTMTPQPDQARGEARGA
jgi:hypothetical protein